MSRMGLGLGSLDELHQAPEFGEDFAVFAVIAFLPLHVRVEACLLYTSDAADESSRG